MASPYVPIEDVAKYFAVSISTIRAWIRQGIIPKDTYIKVGATYRFNLLDVENVLTNKVKEADATESDYAPIQLELDFNNIDEDN
jgi:excisionase family DNA binding protein